MEELELVMINKKIGYFVMKKFRYMLKEGALWAAFLVAATAFCYGFAVIVGLILRSFL